MFTSSAQAAVPPIFGPIDMCKVIDLLRDVAYDLAKAPFMSGCLFYVAVLETNSKIYNGQPTVFGRISND